jgi:hypothetical protein
MGEEARWEDVGPTIESVLFRQSFELCVNLVGLLIASITPLFRSQNDRKVP